MTLSRTLQQKRQLSSSTFSLFELLGARLVLTHVTLVEKCLANKKLNKIENVHVISKSESYLKEMVEILDTSKDRKSLLKMLYQK